MCQTEDFSKDKTPVLSPGSRTSLSAEEGRKKTLGEEPRLPQGEEVEDNLQGDTHTRARLLDASFR